MKKAIALAGLLFSLSSSAMAGFNYKDAPPSVLINPWYVLVGGGYAWSNDAGIENPNNSFWDSADQGYDSHLGTSPFWTIAVGKQVWDYINVDVSYTDYDTFHYQKYQNIANGSTPGFTSARTRFFDLDNQSFLLNVTLHPRENQFALSLAKFSIYPFVSIGAGAGINTVSHFYTVGNVSGVGSTSSIGETRTETSFAWQGSLGLTFQTINNYLAIDVGYRYYDGGKFTGPDAIVTNTSSTGLVIPAPAWSGSLTTNEAFVNFRFLV